jgi:hypothetical protein
MVLANILTASLLLPAVFGTATPDRDPAPAGPAASAPRSPQVKLWTNRQDAVYSRGDPMTVSFQTDVDVYAMVVQIDADGHARVLFPASPDDDNFARGVTPHAIHPAAGAFTVRVDEYPGEGFLFALVTRDPIDLRPFRRGRGWDYVALGLNGRVTDDPYAVFSDLLARLVPDTYPDYAYDVESYYVESHQDYPRFMCYQCHGYVSPAIWDPYAHSCIRFRVQEPPWGRYPTDVYGGVAVVLPPNTLAPRYVIEPVTPSGAPSRPGTRVAPSGTTGGRRAAPVAEARRPVPPPHETATTSRRAAPSERKGSPAPTRRSQH